MMHQSSCARIALVLLSMLVLASTAIAHDDQVYNPDRRSDAPAYSPNRLDLMNESFEDAFPPTGWAMMSLGNANEEWIQTSSAAHSGTYSVALPYCSAAETMNEWLVTPALDFSTLSVIRIEFYEDESYWDNYGDHHYVMVSTTSQTDTGTFSVVSDMTPGSHSIAGFDGGPVTVDLSAYAGESTVYVALRYTGSDADNWYVDDVRIYEPWLHDVTAVDVVPDDWQFAGGGSIPIQSIIKNVGRSTEDFDAVCTIQENGIQVYQETVAVAALAPEDSRNVMFPAVPLASGAYYDIDVQAMLGTDMDTSNDNHGAFFDTYTLPHVPLGLLNTQADCGPCAPANQHLDSYIPTQGNDVAILRIHVWWPGTDALYFANVEQNDFMANGTGADYAPHLRIDQVVDVGSDGSIYAARFNSRKNWKSPLNISHQWHPETETVMVEVEMVQYMPPEWDLRLRVAITEDNVYEPGTNGEDWHNQVFRYMYPDTDGFVVPSAPGTYRFAAHCPVSLETWKYGDLRATVYVQDNDNWKVHNTATAFLQDIIYTVGVEEQAPELLRVKGNHPNPFNPETKIEYELAADRQVNVSIYDVDGSLVRTLVNGLQSAGSQNVIWDGRDNAGQTVSSGTFFYRIDAGDISETRKMTMVK